MTAGRAEGRVTVENSVGMLTSQVMCEYEVRCYIISYDDFQQPGLTALQRPVLATDLTTGRRLRLSSCP